MSATFRPLPGTELPIFRRDDEQYATFYAPGCLCVVERPNAARFGASITLQKQRPGAFPDTPAPHSGATGPSFPRPAGEDWGGQLWRCAAAAVREAQRQRTESFQPECLTLYLNNECSLACTYCYASPSRGPAQRLDLDAIAAAADLVAANCRRKGHPFYAVFHGGGEPTLHREHLEAALALVETAARAHDVEIVRYVATNGLLPEEAAAWLAGRFDLVGLSCDGPPAIHDRQRPRADGGQSSGIVARTAHILHQEGAVLYVRATVTRHNLNHQAEMAAYLCSQFAPLEIHLEPIYRGGRAGVAAGLGPDEASEYVTHFLAAQQVAREHGIPLTGTGSRPADIHGPFCNVFRPVLNLVPGGLATACFKLSRGEEVLEKEAAIGAVNLARGQFELDQRRVEALRRQLGEIPTACRACFNFYHCARECPDRCPLDRTSPGDRSEPGFRCHVQKATAAAILDSAAARLWNEIEAGREKGPHGTRDLGPGAP